MSRNHVMTAALLAALLGVAPAAAQDAETPAEASPPAPAESPESAEETEAPAEGEATEAPAEGEAAEAPNQVVPEVRAETPPPAPAVRRYPRPRPPPPIMVVILPGDRVPEEAVTAAREALVAQVTPLAGGRAVHGLGSADMVAALIACDDDACIGGQLGSAGAQAGVILRLQRRGRQLSAGLEIRDPISGTARQEVIEARIPRDPAEIPAALAEMSAQLASAMPSPPSRNPTLLVTTTHDAALVTIDGEDIGESPVGPIEIADGTHEILVRLAGFTSYRTETQISPGERARVDATLVSAIGGAEGGGGDSPFTQRDEGEEDMLSTWWFWTIVGGGAALVIAVVAIGLAVALGDQGTDMPLDPTGIPLPPITGGM